MDAGAKPRRATMTRSIQVDAGKHYLRRYLTLPRMVTHWHQADEVAKVSPPGGRVLEIGPGSGHVTWLLRNAGFAVATLDFDPRLKPDVAADVVRIPFRDAAFDCVLAAEVLEHIPFEEFGKALAELKRVSGGHVVLSLPAPFAGVSALWNWPLLQPKGMFLGVPYWVTHRFNGEHYWELGKRGYGLSRIRRVIEDQGLRIVRAFRPAPSLYCYFYVLTVA
jgi:ubiquinone/menaquinone biosynthesis C-methylase UbiE